MKKILISIAAVTLLAMMMTNAYAIVEPPTNCGACPGFTPGFWKHNIRVALEYPGGYSSFDDSGVHLTYGDVLGYVEATGQWGTGDPALEAALADLTAKGPGSVMTRTYAANWLNYVAGYGPFED